MRKKKGNRWIVIALSAIMVGSMFAFLPFSNKRADSTTIYVGWIVGEQRIPYEKHSIDANSSIYYAIYKISGRFELDNSTTPLCIGSYCNSFIKNMYWQVFLNGKEVNDFAAKLKEGDKLLLYYGTRIEFFNVSVSLNYFNETYNRTMTLQNGTTIEDMLKSFKAEYNSTSVKCLFSLCGNSTKRWSIYVNGMKIINWSKKISKGDSILLSYE